MARVHELKTWPEYFHKVRTGEKKFELRKNDRDFHSGDLLLLQEWSYTTGYTGETLLAKITYILNNETTDLPGLLNGYSLLSIEVIQENYYRDAP